MWSVGPFHKWTWCIVGNSSLVGLHTCTWRERTKTKGKSWDKGWGEEMGLAQCFLDTCISLKWSRHGTALLSITTHTASLNSACLAALCLNSCCDVSLSYEHNFCSSVNSLRPSCLIDHVTPSESVCLLHCFGYGSTAARCWRGEKFLSAFNFRLINLSYIKQMGDVFTCWCEEIRSYISSLVSTCNRR